MKKSKKMGSKNIFEDLGFSREESRILSLKAQLAAMIVQAVHKRGLDQKDLVKVWKVPQPRVSEVMSGKLQLISIERLIEFLGNLEVEVSFRRKNAEGKTGRKAG